MGARLPFYGAPSTWRSCSPRNLQDYLVEHRRTQAARSRGLAIVPRACRSATHWRSAVWGWRGQNLVVEHRVCRNNHCARGVTRHGARPVQKAGAADSAQYFAPSDHACNHPGDCVDQRVSRADALQHLHRRKRAVYSDHQDVRPSVLGLVALASCSYSALSKKQRPRAPRGY